MSDVSRLLDEVRGLFRGELRADPLSRRLYATDASIFEVEPLLVATPRDAADVAVLVRACHEHGIPLIPRGAGTGLAGESLGPAVIVDLSVHFRTIRSIDAATVTAEAGVSWAALNAELAARGRRFPPDPASGAVCSIGGMVATNASGSNLYRYGYTRDYVVGLEVVWDTGETAWLTSPHAQRCGESNASPGAAAPPGVAGSLPISGASPPRSPSPVDGPRTAEIRRGLVELLAQHRHVAACRPTATPYDRAGYRLDDLLTPDGLDLPRLLVGAEGTLGVITAVQLRTLPLPAMQGACLLGCPTLEAAIRAGLELAPFGPTACDLLDQRLLAVRRSARNGEWVVPPEMAAALLVEFEAATEAELRERAGGAVELARHRHGAVVLAEPTPEPAVISRLRKVRAEAVSGLYALGPGRRPLPCVEDLGVPPERLPEFLAALWELLRRHDVSATFLLHVLTGQVHLRPFLDLYDPADRVRLWPLAEAVYALVWRFGGTISSQHGVGLARTPWLERQAGPLYRLFREVKQICDPQQIFNPGKLIGPDPRREAWPLRPLLPSPEPLAAEPAPARSLALPLLHWETGSPVVEAARCNGCGECRVAFPPLRMCPFFRLEPQEAATPRAKANLFRYAAQVEASEWLAAVPQELAAIAGLCFQCQMCRQECPAQVDVPKLMRELKTRLYAEEGPERGEWLLARLEVWSRWGSRLAPLVNGLLRRRTVRWLLEKGLGLSWRRQLPAFAWQHFLRRAQRRGWTTPPPVRGGPRLAYFVDLYATYHDPTIAEAAVLVLQHQGAEVVVPPRQRGSGLGAWLVGDRDRLRELAWHNVRLLAELVREGWTVFCSEPSAALLLRHIYPEVLDETDEARLVAAHTVELMAWLGQWHAERRLRTEFQPLPWTVARHIPCHLKAVGEPAAAGQLLRLIPGLCLQEIDAGCSGGGGVWGLLVGRLEASLAMGAALLQSLRDESIRFGISECSGCRLQIQQGAGKRAVHPVQLLALAYGLMPQLHNRLQRPLRPLLSE